MSMLLLLQEAHAQPQREVRQAAAAAPAARDTGAGHLQASAMIQDENSFNTVTHNRPSEGDWDGSGGPAGSCTAFSTPPTQSALMADQSGFEGNSKKCFEEVI